MYNSITVRTVLLLVITLVTLNGCNAKPDRYTITGSTTGIKDSTLIYLSDAATSGNLDSTYIINNQFQFSGSIKEKTLNVILQTADHYNYKFFWLENAPITFKAENGKFKNASISGSNTQNDEDILNSMIDPIKEQRTNLYIKYDEDTSVTGRKLLTAEFEKLDKKETEQNRIFIKKYPASIVSANLLNIYSSTWGKETTETLYKDFSVANKQTNYGKEIAEFLELNKDLKVGDKYVDFTQADTHGEAVSLSNFKNKVVLLEFWASWCYGCVEENPALLKIYHDNKQKGFEIFAVSLDKEKGAWLSAIEKGALDWANVSELNGNRNEAALIYGISALPDNLLIDKDGTIMARGLTASQVKEKLKVLLK